MIQQNREKMFMLVKNVYECKLQMLTRVLKTLRMVRL